MKRRCLLRCEKGQAMVEFALVLPILLVLLLGIVQFGIVFNNYETLTDAARVGARQAALARTTGDSGAAGSAAVYSAATNLKASDLGVTVHSCPPGASPCDTDDWSTTGNEVTVTATYPYSIKILDLSIVSGTLTTVTKERLE